MQWNASLQLQAGGTWSPPHCVARQRVAVIIPFRDRAEHLATLLPTLHAMLQGQQLHYTVYVVEQAIVTVFSLFLYCLFSVKRTKCPFVGFMQPGTSHSLLTNDWWQPTFRPSQPT